ENIEPALRDGPLKPVAFGPDDRWDEKDRGKAVIVISGHSSGQLAGFVDRLGEAGVFRDNYVVFNSCEAPLTREMIERINGLYGAAGLFGYQGKINPRHVGEIVKGISGWLKAGGGEFEPAFRDAIR